MWTNWHGLLWLVFTNKRLQVMSVLSKLQSIFCFFFMLKLSFIRTINILKLFFDVSILQFHIVAIIDLTYQIYV